MMKIYEYKFTWKTHAMCLIIAFLLSKISESLINQILNKVFESPYIWYPTHEVVVNYYIYTLLILIPIIFIHEAIHGIVLKLLGRKVKFGFKGIYAYTQDITDRPMDRYKFLFVLLSPLVVISLISIFMPPLIGSIVYLLNLFGSSGDIYMVLLLTRFPSNSQIIDKYKGFEVLLPQV